MNKIHYLGLSLLAFLPLSQAFATVCVNENGVPTEVYYDLTDKFNSSNNQVGQIVTLSEKSQWVGVNAVCPKGTSGNTTKRSYVTDFPVTGTSDGYQYLKLNDYLDGAMKITDSYAGTFYPPRKYIQMGSHPNVSKNKPFGVQDSSLVFRLKVTRRFITMVVIPRATMFRVYVTTTSSDPLTTP
ncbi:type 1 fimbrin D-mannose specific adhesin FimH, partial [Enterobacter cloacae]|nr:type 1 fimbrin D-mannose specific adhesin FimH [Enterobacter cloacae]